MTTIAASVRDAMTDKDLDCSTGALDVSNFCEIFDRQTSSSERAKTPNSLIDITFSVSMRHVIHARVI